jgi:hypothetical protein
MEPVTVTTAILAAIAAGATAGVTDTAKKAIGDAYAGLKTLLKRKFGGDSKVVEAVEKLERDPESAGWKETVGKEAAKAGANQDQELIAAAEDVLAKLKELPADAQQHIQSAIGNYIAQADRGGTAKVIVDRKP